MYMIYSFLNMIRERIYFTVPASITTIFYFFFASNLQYSARDTSPLSIYVMHPFWNHVVEVRLFLIYTHRIKNLRDSILQYFPRWIAPNVMTFVGFLFTALNFVLLSYYDWNFTASTGNEGTTPIPNWVWMCAAFNIFAAYTLGESSQIYVE